MNFGHFITMKVCIDFIIIRFFLIRISSNINGVIKEQFQAFLFFYEEILHTQKKHKMQTNEFHS